MNLMWAVSTHNKISFVILWCGPKVSALKHNTNDCKQCCVYAWCLLSVCLSVRTVVESVAESSSSCLNDVPNDEAKRSGKYTMTICSRNCSGTVLFFSAIRTLELYERTNERFYEWEILVVWLCIIINGIATKWSVLCALWYISSATSTHTHTHEKYIVWPIWDQHFYANVKSLTGVVYANHTFAKCSKFENARMDTV